MAGIIARITRSNRERLDRKKTEITVGKCNYLLDPFDPCFDPKVRKFYILVCLKAKTTLNLINQNTC